MATIDYKVGRKMKLKYYPKIITKAWFACLLILAIAFTLAEFIYILKLDSASFALAIGIGLGAIAEFSFDLETLFVFGNIMLMLVAFLLMILIAFLSATWFKFIFIFLSVAFIGVASAVMMQWLIRNWIFRSFGKFYGVLMSAVAISLGIILQRLSLLYFS